MNVTMTDESITSHPSNQQYSMSDWMAPHFATSMCSCKITPIVSYIIMASAVATCITCTTCDIVTPPPSPLAALELIVVAEAAAVRRSSSPLNTLLLMIIVAAAAAACIDVHHIPHCYPHHHGYGQWFDRVSGTSALT